MARWDHHLHQYAKLTNQNCSCYIYLKVTRPHVVTGRFYLAAFVNQWAGWGEVTFKEISLTGYKIYPDLNFESRFLQLNDKNLVNVSILEVV